MWSALLDEEAEVDPRFSPSEDAVDRWRADFPVWLKDSARLHFVAELDGAVAGFVSGHLWGPEPILKEEVEVFVEFLYVRKAFRRKGVGTALLTEVREWASQQGAVRLRLRSLSRSRDAYAFWQGHGADPFAIEMFISLGQPPGPRSKAPLGFGGNSP